MIRLLPPLTILGEPDESGLETLKDWSRGLEWVSWLLAGVRARHEQLFFTSGGGSLTAVLGDWDEFAEQLAQEQVGSVLVDAFHAASAGHLGRLVELDAGLSGRLPPALAARSLSAGAVLLRGTRGARYQGLLGKYRDAVGTGTAPGHFLITWAVVGRFFQLSLACVLSEYLRMEWKMSARHLPAECVPAGRHSIADLTSRLMHHQQAQGAELRLLAEA